MLNEQMDMITSGMSVQDSIVSSFSLPERMFPWQPLLSFETQTDQVELVEGIPLAGEKANLEFISSILVYTIIYLIFIALLRLRGRGFLFMVYTYFFNRKRGAGLLSEGGVSNYFFVFLSICLSFSTFSMLFAFLSAPPFLFSKALLYFLIVFACYFFEVILIRFLGWTFNNRHCASEIVLNLRTSAIVLGLSISPFVLSLFYVQTSVINTLLYTILGISIILLIFRIVRFMKILCGYRVSILYMFLYLCGLEILPVLVLCKLLV